MSNSFASFMRLVNNAVGAFKGLASFFAQPLSSYVSSIGSSVLGAPVSAILAPLVSRIPFLQSVTMFDVLFTATTVQVIVGIGVVRWFLDILP